MLTENNNYSSQSFRTVNDIQFDTDLNFWRYGLFGQLSREWFGGRLSTSVGIRADGNTFMDDGNQIWNTLSPRLAISYALDAADRWRINGSVGRYFKIPPSTILGFKNSSNDFMNRDADYIRSDHYVAGLSYSPRKSTQFAIEGFLKRYDDYSVSVADSVSLANLGANFDIFGNEAIESAGKGRAYGVEFTYQQKLKKNFYGNLAYTLYWSEFTGFNTTRYRPSLWDSRHLLTFTGGYTFGNNWQVGVRTRIIGGAPYPALNRAATQQTYPTLTFNYNTLGDKRLDVFNTLDLRIDKQWNFSQWSLKLYLEATNVLSSDIPTPPTYGLQRNANGAPVEPRQIVEIEGVDNSSVLPTIGVVIDI